MSHNKKYIVVIVLALAVTAGSIFIFYVSASPKSPKAITSIPEKNVVCALPPMIEPTDSNTATEFMEWFTYHDPNEWYTYHNPKYHFRVDYPCYLSVDKEDEYIAFILPGYDGPGGPGYGIFIEPTSFATPEEEVARSNKVREDMFLGSGLVYRTVIDGSITLNGHTGIVTHEIAEGYDHPFPKDLMFIKDGNLFTISDETVDYQRTWESFHFEE